MSKSQKGTLMKYIAASLFVAVMAFVYISLRDIQNQPLVEVYRIVCDAFTVPGMLLILLGAMVWVSDLGAFYGVGYVVSYAINSLKFGGLKNTERYADYVDRKRSEGHVTGYGFLFVVGGISMVISLVFMFLFYQIY